MKQISATLLIMPLLIWSPTDSFTQEPDPAAVFIIDKEVAAVQMLEGKTIIFIRDSMTHFPSGELKQKSDEFVYNFLNQNCFRFSRKSLIGDNEFDVVVTYGGNQKYFAERPNLRSYQETPFVDSSIHKALSFHPGFYLPCNSQFFVKAEMVGAGKIVANDNRFDYEIALEESGAIRAIKRSEKGRINFEYVVTKRSDLGIPNEFHYTEYQKGKVFTEEKWVLNGVDDMVIEDTDPLSYLYMRKPGFRLGPP